MICKHCGTNLPDNTAICPYCGTAQDINLDPNYFKKSKNNEVKIIVICVVGIILVMALPYILWMLILLPLLFF